MTGPRIQLIHAVTAAQAPIHDAFRRLWPEARVTDLADYSLAPDLAAAGKRSVSATLDIRFVPGALEALNAGDGARHDALLADAAAALPDVDVLLLAQFSMVGARDAVAAKAGGRPVLTAPDEAVGKLRSLLE